MLFLRKRSLLQLVCPLTVLIIAIGLGIVERSLTYAEVRPVANNRSEELRALLKVGLMPVSPAQEAFLDKVVFLVEQRTLSMEMVQGTFIWARQQAAWPYPYFEQSLRRRAKRLKIEI